VPRSAQSISRRDASDQSPPPLMPDATRWGDLVLLSGRAAVDPVSFALLADDIKTQGEIVLDDIEEVLESCGSGMGHILRLECFLADPGDFVAWNALFIERFPIWRPARTTVVTAFAVEGMLIEIQVTAGIPS
jgi:2-iminobutanoate/2-iminopropanoate deaminase